MYKQFVRPLLFRYDPEDIHHRVFSGLRKFHALPGGAAFLRAVYQCKHPALEREVAGLNFINPVGIAAGFDKDGKLYNELADLGFGFVEVGTVTPRPQMGNPRPRLFRLPEDKALINRMGFNNEGVDALVERLKNARNKSVLIGGNIGKNKDTPNDKAVDDYLYCFKKLHPWVDYFVVNVSSPNTPGLRSLQEKGPLLNILNSLVNEQKELEIQRPIFLKIAPDLTDSQLDDIIEMINESGIAGVIATNTTINRSELKTASEVQEEIGAGGLSGKPLHKRSLEVVRYLNNRSDTKFPIIAVGGIFSPQDALSMLLAGASLIQLYTGFIYEGPSLVKRINKSVIKEMQ